MAERAGSDNKLGEMMGPVHLDQAEAQQVEVAGMKASRLAHFRSKGFRVPEGMVIPAALCFEGPASAVRDAVEKIVSVMGDGPFAVRSSGVAEDLADASYAGMYHTELGVVGLDALIEAVGLVANSSRTVRAATYSDASAVGEIAVLIQRMIPADAAGVAFTANPTTGDLTECIIVAVAGIGETLVGGEATGEQWVVKGPNTTGPAEARVLASGQARQVADLARAIEAESGVPQDIEWAIEGDDLYVLQARPMTALGDPVSWDLPGDKGYFRSDLRIGEWLSAPVTPLFETWFLPQHEQGLNEAFNGFIGMNFRLPMHAIVNGWYFAGNDLDPVTFVRMLRRPVRFLRYFSAFPKTGKDPVYGDRNLAGPALAYYRTTLESRLAKELEESKTAVGAADVAGLFRIIDTLSRGTGTRFFAVISAMGFAWKAEFGLANFWREHLIHVLPGGYHSLLTGLAKPEPVPPHAVTSFDWSEPTLSELGVRPPSSAPDRYAALRAEREQAEATCRGALAEQPKLLERFEAFLEVTQRYAMFREEFAHGLTVAWPTMREALNRLGRAAVEAGVIDQADDVHYLTYEELRAALESNGSRHHASVADRRARRARQSRLSPPKFLGTPSIWGGKQAIETLDAFTNQGSNGSSSKLTGIGASPGRATGPVRLVRGPGDFAAVTAGDILVAPTTAPAWTALFGIVAAIITDGGSIAAHASLIAREYGIPAVVGTGDATARLRQGMIVTVDGTKGVVSISQ